MKEIKRTITEEKIVGYEAGDGRVFQTADECKKYENSAKYAIWENFKRLCVAEPFPESNIWNMYGYGSADWSYVVVELKDENDLKIANMYAANVEPKEDTTNRFTASHIGKRVLVAVGSEYDERCWVRGTEEEEIRKFKENIDEYFYPKKEGNEE